MRIYISGPITGLPALNKPAFYGMADHIATKGHEPINPHEVCRNLPRNTSWQSYMRACIRAMMDADAVVLLRGFYKSKGALAEWTLAERMGIPCVDELDTDAMQTLLEGAE